ncbi:hypothetical protein [Halostagnicola sp. A56]|uniref:hypothetical protein n=1 Tax=Halostagnicola sp. A56 TaxID=1495067 RepID=UPI0012E0EB50|nr:hypothetical protein [Halostagnicola sp. A56]
MTDDSDSGDRSTPGGGPTRVVSETSVDDILESIGSSSEGEQTTSDDETERADENRAITDREKANHEAANRAQTTESDESDDSIDRSRESDDEDAFDAESIGDSKPTTTTIETGQPADPNDITEDANTSVSSADDPAPAETAENEMDSAREDDDADLAARIERGAVTGADVRAAESGDGREETTDIGEIDLSMDDLECSSGSAGSSGQKRGRSSTDGPLSGSVGSGKMGSDDDSTEADKSEDSESDSSGVFGRLKGLFSR